MKRGTLKLRASMIRNSDQATEVDHRFRWSRRAWTDATLVAYIGEFYFKLYTRKNEAKITNHFKASAVATRCNTVDASVASRGGHVSCRPYEGPLQNSRVRASPGECGSPWIRPNPPPPAGHRRSPMLTTRAS